MRFCGWEMPVETVDKEVITAWVEALTATNEETGTPKYRQGTGALERTYLDGASYCCLGVLCEVIGARNPGKLFVAARRGFTALYEGEFDPSGAAAHASSSVLPYAAQKIAGFIMPQGFDSFTNETPDGRIQNPPFIMRDHHGELRPTNATQANDTFNLTFAQIAEGLKRTYLEPWTDEIIETNAKYVATWEALGILEPAPALPSVLELDAVSAYPEALDETGE